MRFFCRVVMPILAFLSAWVRPVAAEEWWLEPAELERSPAEFMREAGVLPEQERKVVPAGSGSVQGGLLRSLSLPVTDTGKAGSVGQIRGLGRGAEDVDVQVFGLSLNPAQGGGFDLAAFPQFLWSRYAYQAQAGSTGLDPRGTAGSLSLRLWTEEALNDSPKKTPAWALSEFVSSQALGQLALGYRRADLGVMAGLSSGVVRGPAASLSARTTLGSWVFRAHLLSALQETEVAGTTSFPTPGAIQTSERTIPVFQADYRFGEGAVLKSSFFFDSLRLRYQNPAFGEASDDRVLQVGFQSLWASSRWRLSVGGRFARYRGADFGAPDELLWRARGVWVQPWGAGRLEPELSVVTVTGREFSLGGGIGFRAPAWPGSEVYFRLNSEPRVPSLLDRYAVYPGFFQGNPDLVSERAWTLVAGWMRGSAGRIEGFAQHRDQAQINPFPGTPRNAGWAKVVGLTGSTGLDLGAGFQLATSTTLSASRVSDTEAAYPLLPGVSSRFQLSQTLGAWEWLWSMQGISARTSGEQAGAPVLAGYSSMDFGFRYQSTWGDWGLRLENLWDRRAEVTTGDLLPGRIISVALRAEL